MIPIFVKTTDTKMIEEEIEVLRGFTEIATKQALIKDEEELINKARVEMITARLELLNTALESKNTASTAGKKEDELVAAIQVAVDTKIVSPNFKDTIAIARKIGDLDISSTSKEAIETKLKEITTAPDNPILVGLKKVFGLTSPPIPVISPAPVKKDEEYEMDPEDAEFVKAMKQNIEAAIARAKEIAQAKHTNTKPLLKIIEATEWGHDATLTILATEEANLELKDEDKIYRREWILWRESQLVQDWQAKYNPKLWDTYKKKLKIENEKIKQKHTTYQQLEADHKKKWMTENSYNKQTANLDSLWNEKRDYFYWSELIKLVNADVKKYAIGLKHPERSAWYRWWLNEKQKDWFKTYDVNDWMEHRKTLPPNLLTQQKQQKQQTPGLGPQPLGLEQGRTPLPPQPKTMVGQLLNMMRPNQEQRQVQPVPRPAQVSRQVLPVERIQYPQRSQDPQAIISSMYQEDNSSSYMFYIPIVGILIGISSMFLIK